MQQPSKNNVGTVFVLLLKLKTGKLKAANDFIPIYFWIIWQKIKTLKYGLKST